MTDEIFSNDFVDGLPSDPYEALVAMSRQYFIWWEANEDQWRYPGSEGDHRVALTCIRAYANEHAPELSPLLAPTNGGDRERPWSAEAKRVFFLAEKWTQERIDARREKSALQGYERVFRSIGDKKPDSIAIEADTEIREAAPSCWRDGTFRLFLSHTSAYKVLAAEIQQFMGKYGVAVFVAHEDIKPQEEWLDTIEEALRSMHALLALVTEDFHDSLWTDQEVGWALGRGVRVFAASFPVAPYGFLVVNRRLEYPAALPTRPKR